MDNIKPLQKYSEAEGYDVMRAILNKIYIARNITLNEALIIQQLKVIDQLMRTVEYDENFNKWLALVLK